jgi:hypothetical protein
LFAPQLFGLGVSRGLDRVVSEEARLSVLTSVMRGAAKADQAMP